MSGLWETPAPPPPCEFMCSTAFFVLFGLFASAVCACMIFIEMEDKGFFKEKKQQEPPVPPRTPYQPVPPGRNP